jgi:hypothetical protein
MTRFLHSGDLAAYGNKTIEAANGTRTIELEISEKDSEFTWSYKNRHIIIDCSAMPVEIKLKNRTDAAASITNYASSGVSNTRSPISSFELGKDSQSATFTISLLPNQLIDFGVFVMIEQHGKPAAILFCDPQASNDPIKNP